MPIPVQSIVTRCQASIDSEGSEYFLFNQDFRPAINSAQDWIVGVINANLGNKKFSEEIFKDLTYAQVWQASNFSRITIDPPSTGSQNNLWTILDVIPLPTTYPAFIPLATAQPNYSVFRGDLAHIESDYYATRLSAEEWEKNKRNPFAQGHTLEAGESANSYGYLLQTNYTSSGYQAQVNNQPQEIEIRPSIARLPCTIKYVKVPSEIVLITDNVEFPLLVSDIFVSATLYYLSVKIGDGTTLNSISNQLLQILLSATA